MDKIELTMEQLQSFSEKPEELAGYIDSIIKKPETESNTESWMESLPEDARAEIKKARAEAAKWRVLAKNTGKEELIEELDKLKSIAGNQKEEEPKEDYGSLIEQIKKEKSELEAKYNTDLSKFNSIREEYESERLELLGKLPPELQEAFGSSTKKQIGILLAQINKSAASPGAKNAARAEMEIDRMSLDEQLRLNAENPELYYQLKTKQFQKKRIGG